MGRRLGGGRRGVRQRCEEGRYMCVYLFSSPRYSLDLVDLVEEVEVEEVEKEDNQQSDSS